MRLLQLVHGFPPEENGGTERYAARLATGLRWRGWETRTLCATRRVGARMYATERAGEVFRIVNNAPFAGVRRAERDAEMARKIEEEIEQFRPDIVHVQHLMFLDRSFRCAVPMVWTLHDAWAWCASGGTLLREGRACDGPGPACAPCASAWCRDPAGVARALDAATRIGRWVRPERLHAAWRKLPATVRSIAYRPGPAVTAAQIAGRTAALRAFADRCRAIVSPSRWLAREATRQGLPAPRIIPHGVEPTVGVPQGRAFVFLGTLAEHKGPHLVRQAWERSGVRTPLRVHGPLGPDPAYVVENDGPCEDVPAVLAGAQALVMGSIWPENAPLVALEARAAGCPVIAPRIGGLPEIVEEGRDGWLYPPGDVDALAACIRAAEHSRPRPAPPPTFSWHLDQIEALYRELR